MHPANPELALVVARFEGALNTYAARNEGALGALGGDLKHVTNDLAIVTDNVSKIAGQLVQLRDSFVNISEYERRHGELEREVKDLRRFQYMMTGGLIALQVVLAVVADVVLHSVFHV